MSAPLHLRKQDQGSQPHRTPESNESEVKSSDLNDIMRQISATPPDGGAAPPPSARDIQQLQRTLGNYHTAALLQRWQGPQPSAPTALPPDFAPSLPPHELDIDEGPDEQGDYGEYSEDAPHDTPAEADSDHDYHEETEPQPSTDGDANAVQRCCDDDDSSIQRAPAAPEATPTKPIQRGFFGKIKKGVKKAVKKVKKAGKKFGRWASKPFKWVINKAKKLARKLLKPVERVAKRAFRAICSLIGRFTPDFNFNLGKLIPLNFDWITAGIKKLLQGIAAFARIAAALMGDILGLIKPIISKIIKKISALIRSAFRRLFGGFRSVWGKIPGISAPGIDFGAIDSASRKAMGYAMTGAHRVNELRSQSKKSTTKGGKLGKAISSVMAKPRNSLMKMFEGCLKRVPLTNSLIESAKTLLAKFRKLFLKAGDALVMGTVDEMVQKSPCSDGESSATLQAGASVPLKGVVKAEAGQSLQITKRSPSEVAFTHTSRKGVSAGYESGEDDKAKADPKNEPDSGEEAEKQRKEKEKKKKAATEKKVAASMGLAAEDGETYVYNPTKDGDMLAAGIHTFYAQAAVGTEPLSSAFMSAANTAQSVTGASGVDLGIPMPEDRLESRMTALELSIALAASMKRSGGSIGMEYNNTGKAILEEYTSGERRVATEMSGGLTISASGPLKSGSVGSDTPGEEEMSKYLGEDVSLDSSTMTLEVIVGKNGKVKEVAYVISAEAQSGDTADLLHRALLGEESASLAAGVADKAAGDKFNYYEAGTYEMRFVVRDGLDRLNTGKLKGGDATDFEKVIGQIQDYGELEYIKQGSSRGAEIGMEAGNAEVSFGMSQDTEQSNYQYDEDGNLRDECK